MPPKEKQKAKRRTSATKQNPEEKKRRAAELRAANVEHENQMQRARCFGQQPPNTPPHTPPRPPHPFWAPEPPPTKCCQGSEVCQTSHTRYAVDRSRADLKSTYKRLNRKQKEAFAIDWVKNGGADWGSIVLHHLSTHTCSTWP